ncbi:TPA: hypothetical protein NG625_003790 [Vibrio parahaemolyticus]|nr:hypothetical protein [Vibrio parahaemolyticus]HCG9177398.1 hypothetical protein [Vibrio parahaemolyticus]HCG9887512.1 hypothetical protein [Vibrio parahaemolyticus]HCH1255345.1 hypothetical protein [Vibrio parahaemolyticus]HCH1354040.1 hypothetical protein [Vibrio parahaemolyticus]
MARKANQQQEAAQPEIAEVNEQVTVTDDKPVDHFTNIVREGKAKKLSPKTENHVFYQLSEHDDLNTLHLRISGNEGGGLHSREWVSMVDIITVLNEQDEKPFKSTVFKSVFKGGSANNAGFLAACCRGLGLIIQSEKSVFLHVLAPDYVMRRDEILSLVSNETKPE